MIAQIQSKQDVIRALNDRTMSFSGALEVVNQGESKPFLIDLMHSSGRKRRSTYCSLNASKVSPDCLLSDLSTCTTKRFRCLTRAGLDKC